MNTNIRKPYDKHERVKFTPKGESRTKQAFKDECDINNIMARFMKGQVVTHMNEHAGTYGELPLVEDYQQALNAVMLAQELFSTLPAGIRTKFDNDPAKYLQFVEDPENREEMVKLGLAEALPKPAEQSKGASEESVPPKRKKKTSTELPLEDKPAEDD